MDHIINHPIQTGITDSKGIIKITRPDLEKIISYLAEHHYLYPKRLPKHHPALVNLNILKTSITYLHGQEDYSILSDIINRQFRPTQIQDRTIGAFLFGCMQQDYGDIERGCTISCVNSFNPDHQQLTCSYQLWVQDDQIENLDSRFNLYHPGNTSDKIKPSRAIIYVNLNFEGFTSSEIKLFSTNGITLAELMVKEGSRYKRVQPLTLLENLPRIDSGGSFEYRSADNFIPKVKFGGVTSSILQEDGIYIPFVTAHKNSDNHPIDLDKSIDFSTKKKLINSNQSYFGSKITGFGKIKPEWGWILLIGIIILIILLIYWLIFERSKYN